MTPSSILFISVFIALIFSLGKRTYVIHTTLLQVSNYGVAPEREMFYIQTLNDVSCKSPRFTWNRINDTCLDIIKLDSDFIEGGEMYLQCEDSEDKLIITRQHPALIYGMVGKCKEVVKLESRVLVNANPLYQTHPKLRIIKRTFLHPHKNVSVFTVLNNVQHEYGVDSFEKVLPVYMKKTGFRVV